MTRRLLFFFVLLLSTGSLIAENVMTLTTSKAVGETINLMITLHPYAKEEAWVDLNNNDIKDASESVKNKEMTSYIIQSQIIKIHGFVTLLRCSENELTDLDVSQNRELTHLICFNNAISHLDVSQNSSLVSLNCSHNQLVSLNIRNRHNFLLSLNTLNNPKLSCIYADNACKVKSLRKDRVASLSSFECDPYVAVENVTLPNEAIELDLNATYELHPQLTPWNATFKKLTYDSKDWGIAEVTPDGVIRGKAIGETDIIVYSYLKEKMAVCHVSVTAKTSITITTSQSVPCTLHLFLFAEKEDIPKIWVDKNNDGNKDLGEAISISDMSDFDITSQTVTIYGDVLDFRCERSHITSIDVSNNKKLQKLICDDNELHSIDVSENPELIALGLNDNPIAHIDVTYNPKLVSLQCRRCNAIAQIDVTHNPELTHLMLSDNNVSTLDVSQNPQLHTLICDGNQLTTLDLAANTKLHTLDCSFNNGLNALNVANCFVLDNLSCSGNALKELDIKNNFELTSLECFKNSLKEIDLTHNTLLKTLNCSNNQLDALDLSINHVLTTLDCQNNKLTALNLANGNNKNMNCEYCHMNADENPDLTCIQVDNDFTPLWRDGFRWFIPVDANYSDSPCPKIVKEQSKIVFTTEKGAGSKLMLKLFSGTSYSNPDVWIDLNDNGTRDENENVVLRKNHEYSLAAETITVYGDVTEFEYLGCESNHCRDNVLTSLDVSHNKLLTRIVVPFNHLSTLDVSQQAQLTFLNVSNNNLTALNVMDCKQLKTLNCYYNQLNTLDLSTNKALSFVQCNSNQLQQINLNGADNLSKLLCFNNTKLAQLDVSHNPLLKELHCYYNPAFKQLDVSKNPLLEILYVAGCQLTDLDVSSNPKLKKINCSGNALTKLNLANGFNSKIWQSTAENNPNLFCIQIDPDFTPNNWWTKDATANYSSSDCSTFGKITLITSKRVGSEMTLNLQPEAGNLNLVWIDWNNNGIQDENEKVTSTTTTRELQSQTIAVYGPIVTFNCRQQQVTYLDVSADHYLMFLDCSYNQLSSIDLHSNVDLVSLQCGRNVLETIDVSKNIKLGYFACGYNQLSTIDVTHNVELYKLCVDKNKLTDIDLSQNTKLKELFCQKNAITQLDVSQLVILERFICFENKLSSIDVSQLVKLNNFQCGKNNILALDIQKNREMEFLLCQDNDLTELNVANGHNASINWLSAKGNSRLRCIQIDPDFTPSSTWKKDATANYSDSKCPEYVPEYEVQIEDSKSFHFTTNYDAKRHKKSDATNAYQDITHVEAEKMVEDEFSFKSDNTFPERLFEVVAVDKDEDNNYHFISLISNGAHKHAFKMPSHRVRLTTKVLVTKNTKERIPNHAYFLEMHEGSSLDNEPMTGQTNIDDLVMYKRTFKPTNWYAISFPFEVSRVTVRDHNVEYDIQPCSTAKDPSGHYYLKYIKDGVEHNAVKRSWEFETSIQKNKSYIIAFPNAYFKDKEITFYGGAQRINDVSNKFTEHPNQGGRHYNYRCNTSYNDQIIQDPYLLNAEGTYFIKHDGPYTLKPFMSYIYSVSTDSSAPRRLSMKDVLEPQKEPTAIDSLIENTLDYHIEGKHLVLKSSMNQMIKLTKVNGQLVGHYTLTSNSEQTITLETGVYILNSSNNQAIKIIIL